MTYDDTQGPGPTLHTSHSLKGAKWSACTQVNSGVTGHPNFGMRRDDSGHLGGFPDVGVSASCSCCTLEGCVHCVNIFQAMSLCCAPFCTRLCLYEKLSAGHREGASQATPGLGSSHRPSRQARSPLPAPRGARHGPADGQPSDGCLQLRLCRVWGGVGGTGARGHPAGQE